MKAVRIFILLLLFSISMQAEKFPYRTTLAMEPSPSEQIRCIFFDREGLMWIGTSGGVKSYDGYSFKTYKTDIFSPGILPNNTVLCITEDNQNCLWLGTRNGLVKMNKRTGQFKTYNLSTDNQRTIYTLYTAKDGTIWIGTDGGLSFYNAQSDTFYTYNEKTWTITPDGKKKRIGMYSVKAILEDRNGDFLIGTWATGLMRFNPKKHIFRQYPKLNDRNSAYSLFFDTRHRLWVGTWGYGVLRMDNPDNPKNPKIYQYPYSSCNFDTYYKIIEDPVSKYLWGCTREGISIINPYEEGAQWNNYTHIGKYNLKFNNDLATDNHGNIWLTTLINGVLQTHTMPLPFKTWNLNKPNLNSIYISTLFTNDGTYFWVGMSPYGMALYNRKNGKTLYNKDIPGFSSLPDITLATTISSIIQRNNGEMWFANNSYGIIVKKPNYNAYQLTTVNTNYIKDNYINTLFESRDKTVWVGQRSGLSVVYPNNQGIFLQMKDGKYDFSKADVRQICQDKKGDIWVSTDNEGIIRISGNARNPQSLTYRQYNPNHHNLAIDDATACLEDIHGRLWAISNSGGLLLYNKEKDCFVPMNHELYLLGSSALSLMEDTSGNLWVTTNNSISEIVWDKKNVNKPSKIFYFDKEDGLDDLVLSPNSNYKFGNELFFGSRTNFFSITPTFHIHKTYHKKLTVTDFLIDDAPFSTLDALIKKQISKDMPAFSRHITLPSSIKKLGIEFSLLTYGDIKKNVYAYKLDGYDEEWKYIYGKEHCAFFQNLPSGTYHFHLKACDGYGQWQELPYSITIKVLPPWYASRVAFMLYILLFIGAVFATTRWYKEHLKTKNRLQMGIILTNIGHELLTPLTIISATVYKLKEQAPQYGEDYTVMDQNINRTTRLLRQILEVRKSQAGQLKLLVSRGNLAAFILNACESIRPLAVKREILLDIQVADKEHMVWFDADKLDKILFNLLSNAIKYNREGGKVTVSLNLTKDNATICISDNGIGMSKEKLKHLYTRFFDGDYRKQNMPGTGIGLALTHDLVKLHHGDIHCESKEGEGTTFTISFPIQKEAYSKNEIDSSSCNKFDKQTIQLVANGEKEEGGAKMLHHHPTPFIHKNMNKILVVEDNEDLLALMLQMLSKNYQVLTAKNGKQAMTIIMKEQLDLVVSDVMMPVMDGLELTKRIKTDESFWQLPVILLTAKSNDEDKTDGYAIGADAYITKPFKLEELKVRIDTLISNRKKIRRKIVREQTLDESLEKDTPHYSNPDKAFVEKATEMILKHLDEDQYDRETFAKDMAMGSSSLYNKVKATTGQTIVGFMTTIRMREARKILQNHPDILISVLADRVGFNTPKYFSKCFKKEFGMFPKEYAQQQKNYQDESKKVES